MFTLIKKPGCELEFRRRGFLFNSGTLGFASRTLLVSMPSLTRSGNNRRILGSPGFKRLGEHFPFSFDIVPDDEAVEV